MIEDKKKRGLKLKLKLFKVNPSDEEDPKIRMRFEKKKGSVKDWYKFMSKIMPFILPITIDECQSENDNN